MRVKPLLSLLQPIPANFLLFEFPLLLLDGCFENFGIDSDFTRGCNQVLMADRILLLQFQGPPNDAVDCIVVMKIRP